MSFETLFLRPLPRKKLLQTPENYNLELFRYVQSNISFLDDEDEEQAIDVMLLLAKKTTNETSSNPNSPQTATITTSSTKFTSTSQEMHK